MDFSTSKMDPSSLISKAKKLSDTLNRVSNLIQILEDGLREINANFSFFCKVETEKESLMQATEERHKIPKSDVHGYTKRKVWALSWEEDEQSKNGKFRLFSVTLEEEVVYFTPFGEDPDLWKNIVAFSKVVYRRPLRQTKIRNRLRFAKHLDFFMESFEKKLSADCAAIEVEVCPEKKERILRHQIDKFIDEVF